jgi:hypothetical protein
MALLDGWRRSKLAWRIAGRVKALELTYELRSQKDIQRSLLEIYDLSILARIDTYQQHSSSYQPHLTGTLSRAPRRTMTGGPARFCLTVIETLTVFLKQVEDEFGDPDNPNHAAAMGAAESIIDCMFNFVLFDETSEFYGGSGIRIGQYKPLLAASFLLVQSGYPDIFRPGLGASSGKGILATHHEDWLTSRALDDEANLPALITEYWGRAQRRKVIGAKFSLPPDTVRDNMCDYSDETLDLLLETRERDNDLYELAMNALIDLGANEAKVREALYFAPLLDLRAYSASRFIKVLHSYTQLEQFDDYSSAPQHVRDQCLGLLTVAVEIWGSGVPSLKANELEGFNLVNKKLIDFIMENPSLAPRIADTIIERETVDVESLRVVTGDVLSNGVL